MPYLTNKQAEYVKRYLESELKKIHKRKKHKVPCHFCDEEKDFKKDLGGFFPVAPLVDKEDPNSTLIFDSIFIVWACAPCLEKRNI